MGESQQTRQINHVDPPLAGNGFAVALVASTAVSVNLATIDNQTFNPANSDTLDTGAEDAYVTIQNDGSANLYVVFGGSSAAVTGANAPTVATVGTNAAGIAFCIPPTSTGYAGLRVLVRSGYSSWLGAISASTPTLRIFKSSPYRQAC